MLPRSFSANSITLNLIYRLIRGPSDVINRVHQFPWCNIENVMMQFIIYLNGLENYKWNIRIWNLSANRMNFIITVLFVINTPPPCKFFTLS